MNTDFSIRHFGIVVQNIDESLFFYENLLGFKVFKKMEESGPEISTFLGIKNVKVTTIKMRNQFNQMIELLYYQEQAHKNDVFINQLGPTHLALSVSNLDDIYQNFKKQNIEFISSPIITDNKFAKVAFCKAPEGTFVELVEEL
ncbi:MAG: VOC family protein [Candidatus Neomarinimicrobiota bacterium]|nr:VOC family protein [Candidatus Neomarinimicrobiota bacterium]